MQIIFSAHLKFAGSVSGAVQDCDTQNSCIFYSMQTFIMIKKWYGYFFDVKINAPHEILL